MNVYVAWIHDVFDDEEQQFVGVYSTAEIALERTDKEIETSGYPYPVKPVVLEIEVDS